MSAAVALCHRCQRPVKPGTGERLPVEQGTAASVDVLLHRDRCIPVNAPGGRTQR